jgi:hypothetical protein
MKVNTVVIFLDRLKELELAEKKANEPRSKTIIIKRGLFIYDTIETDDECTEKLANELKEAKNELIKSEQKAELKLKNKIYELKKMNLWDFYIWKKSL